MMWATLQCSLLTMADAGFSEMNISDCSILQILPESTENKQLVTPLRLCYLSETKKLIVTQSHASRGYKRDQRSLIIFDLSES